MSIKMIRFIARIMDATSMSIHVFGDEGYLDIGTHDRGVIDNGFTGA